MASGSVNKVILIGNLGRDPEVRTTQDGREIVNITIATSEQWKDKNTGEGKEKTEWHRVVIFNPALVGVAKNYLHKGSKVYIEGALQTRKWQDNSGIERYTTEIVLQGYNAVLTFLDNKRTDSHPAEHSDFAPSRQSAKEPAMAGAGAEYAAEIDDEIPF